MEKTLNILFIGAHPDDCEIKAGGTAYKLSKKGHKIKFLSLTNGNKGHHLHSSEKLSKIRKEEFRNSGLVLNVETQILNNNDGELKPSDSIKLEVLKIIREFKSNIIITHRPNDYHPDHRYTSQIVQDLAYMVMVPLLLPNVSVLKNNPIFLYFEDHFRKPCKFEYDIIVDVSEEFEKKIKAIECHHSQFYEWLPWIEKFKVQSKKDFLKFLNNFLQRKDFQHTKLVSKIKNSAKHIWKENKKWEAFEICEYGAQPNNNDLNIFF